MPDKSPQHVVSQSLSGAVGAFEEDCVAPSEETRKILSKVFAIYQTVCGGPYVEERPPLELIDAEMTTYKPREAWQRDDDTYVRVYLFGSGQLHVALLESTSDEATVLITYQKYKC